MTKSHFSAVLMVVLLFSASSSSKDKPFPREILSAKSVAVVGRVGAGSPDARRENEAKLKAEAEARLKEWGRFQIEDDPGKADLVVLLMEKFPIAGGTPLWHTPIDPAVMFVFKGGANQQWDAVPLWASEEKPNLLHLHAVTVAINNFEKAVRKADKKPGP